MHRFIEFFAARFRSLASARRQVTLVAVVLFAVCSLTILTAHHANSPKSPAQNSAPVGSFTTEFPAPADSPITLEGEKKDARHIGDNAFPRSSLTAQSYDNLRAEPRIAFSADLGVITKDFVHARSSMEDILDRHRGYAARLRMIGNPAGSSLSATLKVPASEYSSTLADLKSIGDVQQDDESADEVIQQRGDIEARLQNAQNNARRLEQLLKENSEKSIDVDYVRRQLVTLQAEIAQMELQRHSFDNRVVFSNIHFALREVRETPAETLSAQFRHAAVSGFTDLVASLSAIAIFVVGYGPSFLLWAAILFFPARYLWRRSRAPLVRDPA